MKKKKDKKLIILVSIIITSVLLISLIVFLIINDSKSYKNDDNLTFYGVVVEKGSNYMLVDGVDKEKYYVAYQSDDIDTGTFVSISYPSKKDIKSGNGLIEVVLNNDEVLIVDDVKTTGALYLDDVERFTTTTTTSKTIKKSTTESTTSTTQYRHTTKANEDEIINYASNSLNDLKEDKGFLDEMKSTFITLVDFIFYDGSIKGKKFSELTTSAKAKIVYYTLLIDSGIDSKWPNYKENIENKYNNIKAKLLAKYIDLTTSICDTSGDDCRQAKSDFKVLKESVKLTWNTLKNAFSYAYNKGKDSLINWYEIFSGKR